MGFSGFIALLLCVIAAGAILCLPYNAIKNSPLK